MQHDNYYHKLIMKAAQHMLRRENEWISALEFQRGLGFDTTPFQQLLKLIEQDSSRWQARKIRESSLLFYRLAPFYYRRLQSQEVDMRTPLPPAPLVESWRIRYIKQKQNISGWLSLTPEEKLFLAWDTKTALERMEHWSHRGKLEQQQYIYAIRVIRELTPRARLPLTA